MKHCTNQRDKRKLALIGSLIYSRFNESEIKGMMDSFLTKQPDRALFGLPPVPTETESQIDEYPPVLSQPEPDPLLLNLIRNLEHPMRNITQAIDGPPAPASITVKCLDKDTQALIWKYYQNKQFTIRRMASMFKVSQTTIWKVIRKNRQQ